MNNKSFNKTIGNIGEKAVEEYMTSKGYKLMVKNFEVHNVGELDLVFERNKDIYIVEVKTRMNIGQYPTSTEAVNRNKQKKIYSATKFLIAKFKLYDRNIHFLVGQVTHNGNGLVQNVEIVPF